MQAKSFEFVKIFLKNFKKVIDNETNVCYYVEKLRKTKHKSFENNIYVILKGRWIMNKVRFNKRRFFRFVFFIATLAVGAFIEDGNITGALVLAMLI